MARRTRGEGNLSNIVNVAQVQHRSPFRYPGGKTWLVPRVRQWLLNVGPIAEFIEPFCGGAIVGLSVAFEQLAQHVTLLEIDPQVAAVWRVILLGTPSEVQQLVDRIEQFKMSRENVEGLLAQPTEGLIDRAFVTIVRNRVQHGGCLAQGAGMLRSGEQGKGVASRWYPRTIARRIQDIQTVRDSISFLQENGVEYIVANANRADAVFFIDPPYWVAGPRLYDYSELDHHHLFDVVQSIRGDFLMTYDNAPEIRRYAAEHGFATRLIPMQNKNHVTKQELLIGRNLDWVEG